MHLLATCLTIVQLPSAHQRPHKPPMLQGKYGNLDASVVSYGPCQTPTLNFCVERHQKIASFQPEPFWVVRPQVSKGGQRIAPEWGRGRLFDLDVAQVLKKLVSDAHHLKVHLIVRPGCGTSLQEACL